MYTVPEPLRNLPATAAGRVPTVDHTMYSYDTLYPRKWLPVYGNLVNGTIYNSLWMKQKVYTMTQN